MQQLILNNVRNQAHALGTQIHADVHWTGFGAMWGMLGIVEPEEALEICAMQLEHKQGICWASFVVRDASLAIDFAAKKDLERAQLQLTQLAAVCVKWAASIAEQRAECEGGKPCQQQS